jgi:hypothetical protein
VISQVIASRSEQEIRADFNEAIDHAMEKDYSNFNGYQRMVIIFIDTSLSAMCSYTQFGSNPEFIKKTDFVDSDISHMIILPMPSSISDQLSYTAYTKTKNHAKILEEKLPKEFKVFHI